MFKEAETLNAIRELLTPLYQVGPESCPAGHDLDHVERMLKIAEQIWEPEEVKLFHLKLAIWFHNLDRTKSFKGDRVAFMRKFLAKHGLRKGEIDEIVDAVEKHPNFIDPKDSKLLMYLKDCDMLDMGAIGVLRIGGLRGNYLPIYLTQDFQGRTKDTTEKGLKSMVGDVDRALEWWELGMIRTKKARMLGEQRFAFLRQFRAQIAHELSENGML